MILMNEYKVNINIVTFSQYTTSFRFFFSLDFKEIEKPNLAKSIRYYLQYHMPIKFYHNF